ncbi:hypothetical protein KR009_001758 [Drosophila setifemur]|nr:hypothetical protein KR009_001758 [Drosophila setifemur]
MDSTLLFDTTGNQELLGKHRPTIVFNRNTPLQPKAIYETSIVKDCEVDFFGVKLKSKEFDYAVNSSHIAMNTEVSIVAKYLHGKTGSLAVAEQNFNKHNTRKQLNVLGIDHNNSEILGENVGNDMKKSKRKMDPGLDQRSALPTVGRRKQHILNRVTRAKTKGGGWFNLPAPEITEEMRNELKIIQMRSVLNPKQFYKKNDLKVLPKFFQTGTVLNSVLDNSKEIYTSKAQKSLVDELLANESFQKFNKRKYNEIIQRTDNYGHRKAMKKIKKN